MAGPNPPLHHLSRRRFLIAGSAAAASVAVLGACGGDDSGSSEPDESSTTAAKGNQELSLVQFFGGGAQFAAGTTVRAPFGLADKDGLLEPPDTPDELTVQVLDSNDAAVGEPLTVARRVEGIPRPYYPLEVAIAEPGFYAARVDYEGVAADLAFQVHTSAEVQLIKAGDRFPGLDTPTPTDARGVDPICTAEPACPLHDVTAAQALAEARPIAFLVATPAFCQISICGPVLDVLRGVLEGHPTVRGLHAEVFANPFKELNTFAPTPLALKMFSEPVLVLVGSDGVVQKRLDTIFDETELDEALAALT
jgi:hypothetical protein